MADAKLLKDLQIKVNTLKRLVKEHAYYMKDAEKSAEKIEQMKNDPAIDQYNVKKAQEILQETRQMLPLIASKGKKAADELSQFISSNQAALEGTEQLGKAKDELEASKAVVESA
ncbi:tubulin binding cofactor A [Aphelenchoides avenae]|nr:tubulin binding cofactor A [Aphelenchus avenae]